MHAGSRVYRGENVIWGAGQGCRRVIWASRPTAANREWCNNAAGRASKMSSSGTPFSGRRALHAPRHTMARSDACPTTTSAWSATPGVRSPGFENTLSGRQPSSSILKTPELTPGVETPLFKVSAAAAKKPTFFRKSRTDGARGKP